MDTFDTHLPAHGHFLNNIKLAHKLNAAFLLICAIMVAIGGIGLWGMSQLNAQLHTVITQNLAKTDLLGQVRATPPHHRARFPYRRSSAIRPGYIDVAEPGTGAGAHLPNPTRRRCGHADVVC